MSVFENRRRVLALLAAALGAPITTKASGQVKKLPQCSTDKGFGTWKAKASTFGGSFIECRPLPAGVDPMVKGCDFTVSVSADGEKHYGLTFYFLRRLSDPSFDISVVSQAGTRSYRLEAEWILNNAGYFNVFLKSAQVDRFFAEPNPLLSSSMIDVLVAQNGRQLAHYKIDSTGFAPALDFVAKETARLRIAKDQHKCEEPCFMTTACCLEIGLSDNCFELTTMRRFRDEGLAHMPGGWNEIARYYESAPKILKEMRRLGDSHRLISFYMTHILPSAILAHLGFYRFTHALYADLMRRLERRYLRDEYRPLSSLSADLPASPK